MFKYVAKVLVKEGHEDYQPGDAYMAVFKSEQPTAELAGQEYLSETPGCELLSIKFVNGGRRPGCGRSAKWSRPAKPARVPASITDSNQFFNDAAFLVGLLKEYKDDLHPTSPRSAKLRELMGIIEENGLLDSLTAQLSDIS